MPASKPARWRYQRSKPRSQALQQLAVQRVVYLLKLQIAVKLSDDERVEAPGVVKEPVQVTALGDVFEDQEQHVIWGVDQRRFAGGLLEGCRGALVVSLASTR